MRTPIETMIDVACGVAPGEPARPAKMPADFPAKLLAVADAAQDWYAAHAGFEVLTASEQALALAVHDWLAAGGGKPPAS